MLGSASSIRPSRPSGATVQRILNQGKTTLPKEGLEAFGIKAAATGNREYDKNSKLKCVMIKGEAGAGTLVFRCEPNNLNYRNGSWAEKAFFDAVRNNLDWVSLINVDSDMLHWYHNDEEQKNPKNYNIRLFVIPCAEFPSEESVYQLAEYICQNVNAMPSNTTTISVNPGDFFWIPNDQNPVWSDVIGSDAALKGLVEKKGMPKAGYYEQNKEAIHTYFRPQTFTIDLARVLHAPIDQVHPQLRAQMNQDISQQSMPSDEIKIEPEDDDDNDPDL